MDSICYILRKLKTVLELNVTYNTVICKIYLIEYFITVVKPSGGFSIREIQVLCSKKKRLRTYLFELVYGLKRNAFKFKYTKHAQPMSV